MPKNPSNRRPKLRRVHYRRVFRSPLRTLQDKREYTANALRAIDKAIHFLERNPQVAKGLEELAKLESKINRYY
jgi:hypothetical protein